MSVTLQLDVTLILGCMFARKSTKLIELGEIELFRKKRVIYVAYVKDNRYGDEKCITSHRGEKRDAHYKIGRLSEIPEQVVETADVICIDEGQFFVDLLPFVQSVLFQKKRASKHIIIAALNSNYLQTMFEPIAQVLPFATQIVHQHAICTACSSSNASITCLKPEKQAHLQEKPTVASECIGSHESYVVYCHACFAKFKHENTQ